MKFADLKAELRKHDKWREEHSTLAKLEDFKDFFQYTIPRTLRDWKYETIYAWQRVTKGYDSPFVWSHHHRHSELMVRVLKQFKATHVGSPSILFNLNQTDNEQGHRDWEDILDQMIAGFEASIAIDEVHIRDENDEYDSKATQKEIARLTKIQDNGLKLYIKWYRNLWD